MTSSFEVFTRRNASSRFEHSGTIHAPDEEAAILLARETHLRHGEGIEYALCRSDEFHILDDPSLLEHEVDMEYRMQKGYSGFGEKRARAQEAAAERGRGDLMDRPTPGSG